MKVVENFPQNAQNCTILKQFLRGPCPQNPVASARRFVNRTMTLHGMYIQNPHKILGWPPLRYPVYAPDLVSYDYYCPLYDHIFECDN